LPFPEQFQLTPASENHLNLFMMASGGIENQTFFGEKFIMTPSTLMIQQLP
jgi:hypothetical protein